ncbi:MAG TPA: UDP-3-O-acyl-N-acetylglucosamine deacetylase [Gammaproteobacteria bacterium]|nr:UDP-3-O-acyl-N-acetylglucosamine deacetylase [Gammaproteobacteria bacterium]
MLRQRTLRKSVHAIGIGVHSGNKVRMTLRPAEANTGIRFVRADCPDVAVAALAQNVSSTLLSTSISEEGSNISTVEHLMSALWGLAIDNAVIELSGNEVPIMDGSAGPFVKLIESVGARDQSVPRKFIRITQELTVAQGDAVARLSPYDGFKGTYTFVADHPVYNRYPKRVELDFTRDSYRDDLSRARSFGLIDDLPRAHAIDRCLGSSLENAVGVSDDCVLNEEGLRYVDEFAKHKLLDAVGDLYLLGLPLLAAFDGYMSGHALNNELARSVLLRPDSWELVSADNRHVSAVHSRSGLRTVEMS